MQYAYNNFGNNLHDGEYQYPNPENEGSTNTIRTTQFFHIPRLANSVGSTGTEVFLYLGTDIVIGELARVGSNTRHGV